MSGDTSRFGIRKLESAYRTQFSRLSFQAVVFTSNNANGTNPHPKTKAIPNAIIVEATSK